MEQTVKLTSDNQKAALNLTSPHPPTDSPWKRQNLEEIKRKKSDLTLFVAYVMTTWSCVSICTLFGFGGNPVELGNCRMTLSILPRTNSLQGKPVQDTAFLPATQYSRLHRERTDFWTLIFLFICLPVLFLFFFSPWCSHIYSWRIFKLFSGLKEFLRLTNSCCFDIF